MGAAVLGHPQLSYVAQWEPEAASQTFTAGAPIYFDAGLLKTSVDPIDGSAIDNCMLGLAIEDGHNAAAGRSNLCKFIPNIDGVIFYANQLTGDGATNVFAAADLFKHISSTLANKSGLVTTGVTDWFIDDAAGGGVAIVSTRADLVVENKPEPEGSRVLAGDSDARVGFVTPHSDRIYGQQLADPS
jgi:hypothetical protein